MHLLVGGTRVFISSEAGSILMLDHGQTDNAIKLLFTVACEYLNDVIGQDDEKLQVIRYICDIL